jgi:hypothetical protein
VTRAATEAVSPETPASRAASDRTQLWLPLLRRLTASSDTWLVWKNVESAFEGIGDVDAAAARADWPVIEREFRQWAAEQGVGPVVVCRHIPGGLNLIAVPRGSATFLEMGVKAQRMWRGATIFELDDLLPMVVVDERGFRRLRPGAEGLFKLLLNGTRRDGGPNETGLQAKHVRELLAGDPEGARQAAGALGSARRAVLRGARRAAAGGWDRAAMLAVEGWAFLQAVRHPSVSLARIRFRLRGRATCPVVEAILGEGRRIPPDRDGWLQLLARNHQVFSD